MGLRVEYTVSDKDGKIRKMTSSRTAAVRYANKHEGYEVWVDLVQPNGIIADSFKLGEDYGTVHSSC